MLWTAAGLWTLAQGDKTVFARNKKSAASTGACVALAGLIPFTAALGAACSTGKPTPLSETWAPTKMKVHGATITIFTAPTDHGAQLQLTSGIDKSIWVTEVTLGAIMKFSTKGKAEIYTTPTASSNPEAITQNGKDMWFTEWTTPCTGSINAKGEIHEYTTPLGETQSTGMAKGSDGASWFVTDYSGIGRVTTKGKDTQNYFADDSTQPTAITLGPDGNIWFIENQGDYVGKVTPSGTVTEYNAGFNGGSYSFGITSGSDGRIWFADNHNVRIGAINTDGTGLTYYSTGLTASPVTIVGGPDGNLYFGEGAAVVGRITTAGVITEYPFKTSAASFPILSITVGPDKNIWFSNNAHAQVGMLKLPIK
jgi:virginiamycin B lyase